MEFNIPQLGNIFDLFKLSPLLKIGFLIFDLFFIIFLIVVIKQVFSMNTLINDENDAGILRAISLFLLIAALSLFLVSLAIL